MKKVFIILASAIVAVLFLIAGCGKNTQEKIVVNCGTELDVKIYFGDGDTVLNAEFYDTEGKLLPIGNGIFYLSELGEYKLVLKSGVEYIFCSEDREGPIATLNGQSSVVYKGDEVKVDLNFIDKAGSEVESYRVSVFKDEREIELSDGKFIASDTGFYVISVKATDSNGNELNTEIRIESIETVYGKGIYVIPEQDNADVKVSREKYVDGENAGKYRTVIRKDYYKTGFGYLTIKATEEAGLKPDTYYGLTIKVDSEYDSWCYYNPDNLWLTKKSSPQVQFTIKTDSNGEYCERWWTYHSYSSYFDFSQVSFHEFVYGQGVELNVKPNGTNLETTEELSEDGVLYEKRLNRHASGLATLSVSANKDAGLIANKEYVLTVIAECDGDYPAYYEVHKAADGITDVNDWFIDKDRNKIQTTVLTDGNGEFSVKWQTYFRSGTYVKFKSVNLNEFSLAYSEGLTIIPSYTFGTIVFDTLTDGEKAGKCIVVMEKLSNKDGKTALTLSADSRVGLQSNTTYLAEITIDTDKTNTSPYYSMNYGEWEVIQDEIEKNLYTIKFEVVTDGNGEFSKSFDSVYFAKNCTYLKFREINFSKKNI